MYDVIIREGMDLYDEGFARAVAESAESAGR
jgi:hypothetical protein